MPGPGSQACPKPAKTIKQLKARKDREDAKQLKAFRDAVWAREQLRDGSYGLAQWAACQHCHRWVFREEGREPSADVHHRIGRRNKATRYDPGNGVLLCNHLVNDCHRRAQAGEITI